MGEGTFVQMDGDATNSAGARYALAGDKLTASGSGVRSGIESAEGAAPWGNDKFGQAFLKQYGDPQHGDETLTFMTEGGDQVSTVGNAVQWAAVDGIDADSQAKQSIHSLETDKPKVTGSSHGGTRGGILTATRVRSERTGSSGSGTSGSGSTGTGRTTGAVDAMYATAERTDTEGTGNRPPDRRMVLGSVAAGSMMMLHAVDETPAHDGARRMAHEVFHAGVGWVTDGVLPEGSQQPGAHAERVEFLRPAGSEFTATDGAPGQQTGELHAVYRSAGDPTGGAVPMHAADAPPPGSAWTSGPGQGEFHAFATDHPTGFVAADQQGLITDMKPADFQPDGSAQPDGLAQPVDGAERYVQEVYREGSGWVVADGQAGGVLPAESAPPTEPGAQQV
ncbi:hypothetical protein AB0I55_07290 [Actinocatenispora sera]|uniref:hypothetical protein n=1 Tax=Actinocatenispora sera TaxID=390989 RepID=UPI00340317DC